MSRGLILALGLLTTTTGCMGKVWWKTKPQVEEGRGKVEARKASLLGFTKHGTTLVVSCQDEGVRVGMLSQHRMLDTRRHDGVTQARIQVLPEDGKPWRDRWMDRNLEGTGVWFSEDEATQALFEKEYFAVKFRAPGYRKPLRFTFAIKDLKKTVSDVKKSCEVPGTEVASR